MNMTYLSKLTFRYAYSLAKLLALANYTTNQEIALRDACNPHPKYANCPIPALKRKYTHRPIIHMGYVALLPAICPYAGDDERDK